MALRILGFRVLGVFYLPPRGAPRWVHTVRTCVYASAARWPARCPEVWGDRKQAAKQPPAPGTGMEQGQVFHTKVEQLLAGHRFKA